MAYTQHKCYDYSNMRTSPRSITDSCAYLNKQAVWHDHTAAMILTACYHTAGMILTACYHNTAEKYNPSRHRGRIPTLHHMQKETPHAPYQQQPAAESGWELAQMGTLPFSGGTQHNKSCSIFLTIKSIQLYCATAKGLSGWKLVFGATFPPCQYNIDRFRRIIPDTEIIQKLHLSQQKTLCHWICHVILIPQKCPHPCP